MCECECVSVSVCVSVCECERQRKRECTQMKQTQFCSCSCVCSFPQATNLAIQSGSISLARATRRATTTHVASGTWVRPFRERKSGQGSSTTCVCACACVRVRACACVCVFVGSVSAFMSSSSPLLQLMTICFDTSSCLHGIVR